MANCNCINTFFTLGGLVGFIMSLTMIRTCTTIQASFLAHDSYTNTTRCTYRNCIYDVKDYVGNIRPIYLHVQETDVCILCNTPQSTLSVRTFLLVVCGLAFVLGLTSCICSCATEEQHTLYRIQFIRRPIIAASDIRGNDTVINIGTNQSIVNVDLTNGTTNSRPAMELSGVSVTQNGKSKNQKMMKSQSGECMICLEYGKELVKLQRCDCAKGGYHENCLKEWLHHNNSCPVCRKFGHGDNITNNV